MPISVLVADDDEAIRELLTDFLTESGYKVDQASDGRTVLKMLEKNNPDALLLDNRMPDMDGLTVLKQMRNEGLDGTPTIVMTAHGTSSIAIQSIQNGAYDYLTKPLDLDKLLVTLRRMLEHQRLTQQLARYEDRAMIAPVDITERIVGSSEAIQEVFKTIGRVAESDAAVLISGETGTGKELVAQTIFQHSSRRTGPFIRVNCAALPETLLESELFGHEKGAFTGAVESRKGRFELANGGTIFLDEIGEMTLSTQRKLLRVLQSGEFQRVGGQKDIDVDVRVLAATNKNLPKEVDAGNFREDLFYRLNVITIILPALRERISDIPPLVAHFLDKYRYRQDSPPARIVNEAMEMIVHHSWPGNVRELENTIQRAVILSGGNAITPEHLDLDNARSPYTIDLSEAVREGRSIAAVYAEVEREMYRLALIQCNGNEEDAARLLGIKTEESEELSK
jgi:two-component system, NtrC family, response regulator AtoC